MSIIIERSSVFVVLFGNYLCYLYIRHGSVYARLLLTFTVPTTEAVNGTAFVIELQARLSSYLATNNPLDISALSLRFSGRLLHLTAYNFTHIE